MIRWVTDWHVGPWLYCKYQEIWVHWEWMRTGDWFCA